MARLSRDSRGIDPTADSSTATRFLGALAIGAGAIVELVVIDDSATDLDWLVVPLVAGRGRRGRRAPLRRRRSRDGSADARTVTTARIRVAALACGFGILLVGPAIWSVETLGHPTSGTFPAGGPESAS